MSVDTKRIDISTAAVCEYLEKWSRKLTDDGYPKAAMLIRALVEERDTLTADLDLWQHCANCHQKMEAPGHCSHAESEAVQGWKAEARAQADRAEAAEQQVATLTARVRELQAELGRHV